MRFVLFTTATAALYLLHPHTGDARTPDLHTEDSCSSARNGIAYKMKDISAPINCRHTRPNADLSIIVLLFSLLSGLSHGLPLSLKDEDGPEFYSDIQSVPRSKYTPSIGYKNLC
jgi:hypothetical protein